MTAIDNDAVFGSENNFAKNAGMHKDNQTGIKAGMRMDKELAERIKETARNPAILQTLFKNLLSEKEIKALTERFMQLSQIIEENEVLEKEREKNGDTRKLLLSEEDWKNGDMEELVKEEMRLSQGARSDVTEGECGNSYISRFMFFMGASDEHEKMILGDLELQKAEAMQEDESRNEPETESEPNAAPKASVKKADTNTEDETLKAFCADTERREKRPAENVEKDESKRNLPEAEKKTAIDAELRHLDELRAQYAQKVRKELLTDGYNAVIARFDSMGLEPDELRMGKQRVKDVYKTILTRAKQKSIHLRDMYGSLKRATNPNIY